jgi:hypothetical protein
VPLSIAQKRFALKTQSGFVNLYSLMGGDGSMTKWVEDEPVLANKDYTHFNYRGSRKIADLLSNQLSKSYETYKILRRNRKIDLVIESEVIDTTTIKTVDSDE